MSSKNILAAVVVAMAVVTGLSTAVALPANADPADEQLDKLFLDTIHKKGVPVKDGQDAIDLAHSTCDVLNRGGSVTDALQHIKNAEPSGLRTRTSPRSAASPCRPTAANQTPK